MSFPTVEPWSPDAQAPTVSHLDCRNASARLTCQLSVALSSQRQPLLISTVDVRCTALQAYEIRRAVHFRTAVLPFASVDAQVLPERQRACSTATVVRRAQGPGAGFLYHTPRPKRRGTPDIYRCHLAELLSLAFAVKRCRAGVYRFSSSGHNRTELGRRPMFWTWTPVLRARAGRRGLPAGGSRVWMVALRVMTRRAGLPCDAIFVSRATG